MVVLKTAVPKRDEAAAVRHGVMRVIAGAGLAAVLSLGACGGSTEDAANQAAENAAEGILDGLGADGVNIDLENNSAEIELDGGIGAMGDNLDRPSWLADWVQLPDGLSIQAAVTEPSIGESTVFGAIDGADLTAVLEAQRSMVTAAGYEIIEDSVDENGFEARHTDGRLVDVGMGGLADGTARYSLDLYETSSDEARQATIEANAIEGTGTFRAVVGDEVYEATGPCEIEGTTASFSSDFHSLVIDTRADPDYVTGNVVVFDGSVMDGWMVVASGPDGATPEARIHDDGFEVEAPVSGAAFNGDFATMTAEVSCVAS